MLWSQAVVQSPFDNQRGLCTGCRTCHRLRGYDGKMSVVEKVESALKLQAGSKSAIEISSEVVRKCGTVTIIGVYGGRYNLFPLGNFFDRNITLRMEQCPAQKYVDPILSQSQTVPLTPPISSHTAFLLVKGNTHTKSSTKIGRVHQGHLKPLTLISFMVNDLTVDECIERLGKGTHRIVGKYCEIRILPGFQASDPVIHTAVLLLPFLSSAHSRVL